MPQLLREVTQGVLTLELNRADALNGLSDELSAELTAAVAQAQEDPEVRAVLLTGKGRAFCAGGDLQTIQGIASSGMEEHLRNNANQIVLALRQLRKPVVAAVNGVAYGAGMSLALACDVVLAAESAKFSQSFARIGLIPDMGSTWLLPRLVGEGRARALMMLAEPIDAETAMRIGVVWRVFPDSSLTAESMAIAQRLARMPTTALGLVKEALDNSAVSNLAGQLECEARLQQRAAQTQDFREGLDALLNRRPPSFTGV